jgi:LPS-assembly lipoprotein
MDIVSTRRRTLHSVGVRQVRYARHVRRGRAIVAALGAALALTACGFRLAGSDPLPGVLARPYLSLKDPYTDFSREFEHQLKNAGAAPQAVRANATATIDVTKDLVVQRTLSVSAQNIPTEYELTYTVTFAVQGTDKELLAPQTISLSKDYSFEENVLLAKEHEADILREQMARDLVAITMRRLTSLK